MPSFIQEATAVLSEIATVAVSITADKAELEAGQPVTLPRVQVGTVNVAGVSKPLYLEGTLATS